jgi:Tfp pilus assembly protein PilW
VRYVKRRANEQGFSLAELLISTVLTLVVLIMGYQVLSATRHTAAAVGNRAQNSTDARLAIDYLEANLRYADAVWVTTVSSVTTMTVQNTAVGITNDAQPTCAAWTLPTAGLTETSTRVVSGVDVPLVAVVIPGASPYVGTGSTVSAGFSLPLGASVDTLVEIDLSVNIETVGVISSDAVTVHDLIAPNNLASALEVPSGAACSP